MDLKANVDYGVIRYR